MPMNAGLRRWQVAKNKVERRLGHNLGATPKGSKNYRMIKAEMTKAPKRKR